MPDFQVPTHEITTPIEKHKVVLKDFISGYDDEAIEAIYTRGKHKIKPLDPDKPNEVPEQDMEMDGSAIQDAEREGVKRVVVSVDGSDGQGKAEGVVDLVYSMHRTDTKYVKKMVDEVVNPAEDRPSKKASAAPHTKDS